MRFALIVALLASLAACASKKVAAKNPNPIENAQPAPGAGPTEDKGKAADGDETKPPPAPGPKSDPCEGGEYHAK
jgi:hypothetical protein